MGGKVGIDVGIVGGSEGLLHEAERKVFTAGGSDRDRAGTFHQAERMVIGREGFLQNSQPALPVIKRKVGDREGTFHRGTAMIWGR